MAGGIFCIENWSGDLRSPETVGPLLDFLSRHGGARVIHQRVSTTQELGHYLQRFTGLRSYQVAYLALHGARGNVFVGNASMDLERLVAWSSSGRLDAGFERQNGASLPHGARPPLRTINGGNQDSVVDLSGKVLFLGSCAALGVSRKRLVRLREETGAVAICGFNAEVEWYEAAGMELLLLATLAEAIDERGTFDGLADAIRRLRDRGGGLLHDTLGFVCEPDWHS